MRFTELAVLLPCHSLEDFPIYHEAEAAQELLTAWCALWHPALLAAADAIPTWHRVDLPPDSLADRLVTLPPFCADRLPAGYVLRVQSESGWLVQESNLDSAVAAALAGLGDDAPAIDAELAADFLALGFCRLQVELLTRHMRYSTNIDETHFRNEALAAAQAAVAHDDDAARTHLEACFATLYESRKHFYPVDVYLLDFTLVADSTLGESLRREVCGTAPTNLQLPSGLLRRMADEHPETLAALLTAIDEGRACVTGGEPNEDMLPVLPLERVQSQLTEGIAQYETILGRPPQVYARRRAGLWPPLVQLLVKSGYQGALHFTLDDGRFPLGPQSKTRWEGLDSNVIDILARVPSDAAKPETFLGLSRKIADAMDNDHVATVSMAHWPSASSPWLDVLRRVARWSPVLGKFMLVDDYFSQTDMPGRLSRFEPDEYRTPYLKQAVIHRQSNPISSVVAHHQADARRLAASAVHTMAGLTEGKAGAAQSADPAADLKHLAGLLARGAGPLGAGSAACGQLVVNALGTTRRVGIDLPAGFHPPVVAGSVIATGTSEGRSRAVVEVPAMGFVWVEPGPTPTASSRAKPIARGNVLRNEFFELTISRTSGGIGSLVNFNQRGNQLSQQLALRLPSTGQSENTWDRGPEPQYTTMQASEVEVTAACPAFGEIRSRGTMIDPQGKTVCRFTQTYQVWAGQRTIWLQIELEHPEAPRADPWNSYYAARFAWADEAADLYRGVGLVRQRTEAKRLESPDYFEIESPASRLALLTGGLPYHVRTDLRKLDSLLSVRGETATKFILGIGVDVPQPAAAALELMAPPLQCDCPRPSVPSGWYFHLSAKNIVATHWEPLVDDADRGASASGRVRGFRARLLETAGLSGRVVLRAFHSIGAARQVDFRNQTLVELQCEDDKITLDFAACEWIEVEAIWSGS